MSERAPSPEPGRPRGLLVGGVLVTGVALTVAVAIAVLASGAGSRAATGPSASVAPVPPVDPLAWDDVGWLTVVDPGGAFSGPLGQRFDRIVAGGPGLIAAGQTSQGMPGAETGAGTIWLSETGDRWVRQGLPAMLPPGDVITIHHLAAGPRGVVALGGVCCTIEQGIGWWSADGLTWEVVTLPAEMGPLSLVSDLAAGPDGFVAVGAIGDTMAAFTSPDGRAWSMVDAEDAGFATGSFTSVARDESNWLIVGVRDDRPTHDGVVYRSADLSSWMPVADERPLTGPDEVELFDVHPFSGGYLLIGNLGTHQDRVRCEQLLGLGDGRLASGEIEALSCGWGITTHWWSPDGESWRELPPVGQKPGAPPLPLRPDGRGLIDRGPIRAGGPGLVTIGYETAGANAVGDARAVWVTADGSTWNPVGPPRQLPPTASISDMVVLGRSIVAVGSTWSEEAEAAGLGEDGAVWIGTILP